MASATNGQETTILKGPVDGIGDQLHWGEITGTHDAGTDAQSRVAEKGI